MEYVCDQCDRKFKIPEYLLQIFKKDLLIRIQCNCEGPYPLDIVVGADQDVDDETGEPINISFRDDYDPKKYPLTRIGAIMH